MITGRNSIKGIRKFAQIDDIEVLVQPGNMSREPELFMKDKEKNKYVSITIDSHEYENSLGEFFIRDRMFNDYQEDALKVMNELAEKVEDLGSFRLFTLKNNYYEKLMSIVRETMNID